jgi:hypothetical protein
MMPKAKLLGGSPQALIRQEVEQRFNDMRKHAPLTTCQIGLGLAAFPFQSHLCFSGINHSLVTGFLCYGNGFNVLKRVYGLYMYQQPLERQYRQFPTILCMKIGLTIGCSLIFRTDLYPVLEQSMRWSWAFTTDSKPLQVNGWLSIPPPLFPVALSFMESSFTECLLGIGISLTTCYFLELKRGEESVLDYAYKTYSYYYNLFLTLVA